MTVNSGRYRNPPRALGSNYPARYSWDILSVSGPISAFLNKDFHKMKSSAGGEGSVLWKLQVSG